MFHPQHRLRPRLVTMPEELHDVHRRYGHQFSATVDGQVRVRLGPGHNVSSPGPDLAGTHDLLDTCLAEFLRFCPRGGYFAIRHLNLLVIHFPREHAIADLTYHQSGRSDVDGRQARRPATSQVTRRRPTVKVNSTGDAYQQTVLDRERREERLRELGRKLLEESSPAQRPSVRAAGQRRGR